jgi:hypothetical protein
MDELEKAKDTGVTPVLMLALSSSVNYLSKLETHGLIKDLKKKFMCMCVYDNPGF